MNNSHSGYIIMQPKQGAEKMHYCGIGKVVAGAA